MALLVANWKMNLDVAAASLLLERLTKNISNTEHELVLCPSSIALFSLNQSLKSSGNHTKFSLGAQNIYYEDEGAFTGEISAYQIKNLVDYTIIGHSERRHIFHETDDEIAKKVTAAIRHDITPILCIGETLTDHEAGQTNQVIIDQLTVALDAVDESDMKGLVIAYEPVWAIGTGHNATSVDVTKVLTSIRTFLQSNYNHEIAKTTRLLYGGSVNTHDFAPYLALQDCNGLLIGHASLNDAEFATIATS